MVDVVGKYQRYAEYKDSGVEWLGEIPNEWKVLRYKNILRVMQGMAFKSSEYVDSSSVINVRMGNIKKGGNIDLKYNTKYLPENYKNIYSEYILQNGDAIIAMTDMSPTLEFLAVPAILEFLEETNTYLLNQRVGKLLLNKEFDIRFVRYLLLSDELRIQLKAKGLGTVQSNMSNDDLYSSYLFCPSAFERLRIVQFLDNETAKIDSLIEKQKQLIQLLKEKRQAVISHAVTKGLDPSVKMKDSGVEWLGEVPEHWKVIFIKHITEVKRGASPRPIDDPKYFNEDGEYAWTRIADVSKAGMYLTETTQRLSNIGSLLSVRLNPNELFLSIAGSVGKPCITVSKACIHDGFVYFPTLKINNKFLYYIFEAGQAYLGLGKMGTQLNLNTDSVGGIKIGLPLDNEIEEIISYIERQNEKYDILLETANKKINLLSERRTALISAAVTGKIDVRNWQNPNDAKTELSA